jgi:TetR/AcrR family transcriptional repressor of nem operon
MGATVNDTSVRPRLSLKGERTRPRIVEKAAALIYERSVAATTLKDVKVAAGQEARVMTHCLSKCREPTSAMAANESGLCLSAEGESEEGIDRNFERTGTPLHLGE